MVTAESPTLPRRTLATVAEIAERYRTPKATIYDLLRRAPEAGVLRIGRKILVDVEIFDRHLRDRT
jgi:hypothetical protein